MCRISDDIIIRVRTICTGLSPGNRTMSNTTAMKQGLLLLRMHLGSAPVVSCCWVFFVFVLFFVCMSVWLVAHLLLFSVFCVLFVFLLFLLPNVTSVSGLFILVSSAQCYRCFGTVHSCFFCPMLPVFRDCSFLIAPFGFPQIYMMREITIKGQKYEDRILQTILNFNILDNNGSML